MASKIIALAPRACMQRHAEERGKKKKEGKDGKEGKEGKNRRLADHGRLLALPVSVARS